MDNFNLLSDRIAWALKQRGMKQAELARLTGVKAQSISCWLNGRTKQLSGEVALKAAKALQVNQKWLVSGKGVPEQENMPSSEFQTDPIKEIEIPEVQIEILHEVVQFRTIKEGKNMKYPEAWFKENGIVAPENIVRIRITDDAMMPLLYKGDIAITDTSKVTINNEGVFVLFLTNQKSTIIRRVVPLLTGGYLIKAFNKDYPDESVSQDVFNATFKVAGKVILKEGKGGL